MPREIRRDMPINMQTEHAAYFQLSSSFFVEKPEVMPLKHVVVFSNGIVWKGKLVKESLASPLYEKKYTQRFLASCIIKSMAKGRVKFSHTRASLIVHDEWGFNYFHWLTSTLPRLYLVRDLAKNCALLLPDTYCDSVHLFTIKRFGITNVDRMHNKSIRYVSNLCFPLHTAPASDFNPSLLHDAVNYLVDGLKPDVEPTIKLYISRKNTTARKIINEPEVIDLLVSHGFVIAFPEEKDFEEQVRIFACVKILISIHGAGLTNMMFMPAGGYVLEFRNSKNTSVANNCYFNLSGVFGHHYLYQACEPDSNLREQQANIYVDINKLKASLDLMNSLV